jgi:hypothetical protein
MMDGRMPLSDLFQKLLSALLRVSFYAGGAAYIDFLSTQNPDLVRDLPKLFAQMMGQQALCE